MEYDHADNIMKKIHIINLEKMGGVERLFLQYINEIANTDDIVICISIKVGQEIRRQIPDKSIIFANRLLNSWSFRCPKFLRKYLLQWKINRINADVTIIWDLIPELVKKPKRGKLLYYDHGYSWRYAKNAKTLRFFSMLDGVIAISYASKRVMELRFNLPCKIFVVINRIKYPYGVHIYPKMHNIPIRLGTASRLVTLKGISIMLLTLKELLYRGNNVVLEIAGKGPAQKIFEKLATRLNIHKKVNFTGFQHNMINFFNQIDIYLSTPITEPFGLSSMEALYFGIPVIFPIIDGQPEVIIDGKCGFGITPTVSIMEHYQLTNILINFPHDVYDPVNDCLIKPKLISHIECANAIEKIMLSKNYSYLSENAKSYSREKFDYHKFCTEFKKICEN